MAVKELTTEEFEAYSIKSMTIKQLASLYRTYKNDFITVQAFADDMAVSDENAERITKLGRLAHELGF